jgi:hypothetical protein
MAAWKRPIGPPAQKAARRSHHWIVASRTAFDLALSPAVLDQIEPVGANGRPVLNVAKVQRPDGLFAYHRFRCFATTL